MVKHLRIAIVACAFAFACGGDSTSSVATTGLCTSTITLTVGQGLTPSISWSPSCRVAYLTVEDIQNGDTYWAIGQPTGFTGPVIYGTLPVGATQAAAATPLVAGRSYSVTAYRSTGQGSVIGEAAFTR